MASSAPCDNIAPPSAPSQTPNYCSLPSPRHIRVLKLPESQGSSETALNIGGFHTFSIDDAPPFKALSYTWGKPYREDLFREESESKPEFTQAVVCNEQPAIITENLFNALVSFRKIGICGYMWIDALCIDQSNDEERTCQIQLMSEVYSAAEEVIAWLGEEREEVNDFIWATTDFLHLIMDPNCDKNDRNPALKPELKYSSLTNDQLWPDLDYKNPAEKLIRVSVYQRQCRWMSRRWVVQEIALAKKIRMFSGHQEISFERSHQLASIMGRLGWDSLLMGRISQRYKQRSWQVMFELKVIANLKMPRKWSLLLEDRGPFSVLGVLLRNCAGFRCWDAHDAIFAFLGIVDSRFPREKISQLIIPNYQNSSEHLYQKVASYILQHVGLLDAITPRLELLAEGQHLPSWVPDYSSPISTACALLQITHQIDAYGSDPLPSGKSFLIDGNVLEAQGVKFDSVASILGGSLNDSFGGNVSHLMKIFHFLLSFNHTVLGISRLETLLRVLCIGQSIPSASSSGMAHQSQGSYYFELQLIRLLYYTSVGDLVQCSEVLEVLNLSASHDELSIVARMKHSSVFGSGVSKEALSRHWKKIGPWSSDYNGMINRCMYGRSLFKTCRGLMGMGLEQVKEGDQVWVLSSARAPMVLRPTSDPDEFTIVGDCYVHGIMHGEVLSEKWGLKDKVRKVKII